MSNSTPLYFFSLVVEWSVKDRDCGGIKIRPPVSGTRIVLKLHWKETPLACANFATLCYNASLTKVPLGEESGKPLTYRGSTIHRIVPQFVLQGGDIVFGNGTGGESIYGGKKFKDERPGLQRRHNTKGTLSMGNSGKNSNTSQFFITLQQQTPQCDGKHVVFGQVVSGFEVLDYAETFGTTGGDPTVPVTITDCGVFQPLHTPGAGYWFDRPDSDAYTGTSPVFMVRPRVALVAPTTAALDKFQKALGSFAAIVATLTTTTESSSSSSLASTLADKLETFAIDVILVAPASKEAIVSSGLELPAVWGDEIAFDEVVIDAKPVGALAALRTRSWMSQKRQQWPLDGAVPR